MGSGAGSVAEEIRKLRLVSSTLWQEDAFQLCHTAVYGSWYDPERKCWGYACCNGTSKSTQCSKSTLASTSKRRKLKVRSDDLPFDWSHPPPPTELLPRDKVTVTGELLSWHKGKGCQQ